MIESALDCLHISENENQITGVVLTKDDIMCFTSMFIFDESSLTQAGIGAR